MNESSMSGDVEEGGIEGGMVGRECCELVLLIEGGMVGRERCELALPIWSFH
jgi:hypothetical protein